MHATQGMLSERRRRNAPLAGGICLTGQKMLQFYTCHVRPSYCILCVHTDSHAITCC
jgi:hypothetical protein